MICNQLIRILVFILFSTVIILSVSEPQSESSNYHFTELFESLLRKWQQFFDKTKWIPKIDVDKSEVVDVSVLIKKQEIEAENVLPERTAVIGSMVPVEQNFLDAQFLGMGRQQITSCTCTPVDDGDGGICATTCLTEQTPCSGRICTRTTIFSAFLL